MDTNKNVGINEFSGGMNSDLNYNTLQHNQYIYGENIRLTANSLINQGENPDKKEGVIAPIPEGILVKTGNIAFNKILAIEQIDNICVIIVENVNNNTYTWSIYRITYNTDKTIDVDNIFNSASVQTNEIPKFSTVINKEVNGIIKLYIADGEHEIMVINVNSEFDDYNLAQTENSLISNAYFPKNKITIINTISGQLPVGQVQYTYRFYKKYGIKSKLAPLTNKIQVISSAKNKEQGNAENTTSSIGLQLGIEYDSQCATLFDKIQVFRIYYKKIDVDADIELIYDEKISNQGYIKLNDVGKNALKEYSAEEFALLDGQDIIPQCIQHNQGYMFAANVIDKTIINDQIGEFDARAFSANKDGDVIVYKDQNTEYIREGGQWIEFSIDDVDTYVDLQAIKDFTLNKYADMNIEAQDDGYVDDVCRYDKDGFLGGTGRYVSWRFVTTKIPIDNTVLYETQLPPNAPKSDNESLYYLQMVNGEIQESVVSVNENEKTIKDVFGECGILANNNISYNDVFVSSIMKSLRRDEVYRYGIILYDKNGRRSDVNWIADIKTPTVGEFGLIERRLELDDQFSDALSYVSTGGLSMSVGRTGDDEDKISFGRSIAWASEEFDTEAGQYLYCDERSVVAATCQIEIFRNQNDLPDVISAEPTKVYEFQLQTPTNITNLSSIINKDLTYTQENGDALRNITLTTSNVMVHLDSNTAIPIDEYNNSSNRLQAHSNIWVSVDFNVNFDIVAKYFSVNFAINAAYGVYVNDEEINVFPESEKIYAKPIGIEFNVKNLPENIIGYQIVRCAKDPQYRKNIMQCVAAVPIRQQITEIEYSPYYPHYLLTTNPYTIKNYGLFGFGRHGLYGKLTKADTDDPTKNEYDYYDVATDAVPKLFQLYSPEITNRRTDSLQILSDAETLQFFGFAFTDQNSRIAEKEVGMLVCYKDKVDEMDQNNQQYDKSSLNLITRYYDYLQIEGSNTVELKQIQDVKNPLWENAYSNVQLGATGEDKTGVTSATKQYKSYVTSIGDKEYVNWICNAMYDIKAFKTDVNKNQHYDGWAIISKDDLVEYEEEERDWYKKAYDIHDDDDLDWFEDSGFFEILPKRIPSNSGFVGPGPVCFIANVDINGTVIENIHKFDNRGMPYIGTAMVNVQHKPIQYAGLSNSDKTLDLYFGFGNFCTVYKDSNTDTMFGTSTVFDGDVYIIPFEIVQMFKTYDFNSDDMLQSAQFIYYVPIESPINTYFDYGMNYKNTQSKILQLEPGEISGVSSQDRPLSQYNMVFSDNSTSNDVYNAVYNEDQISEFKNRIWFSNQKTSGEYIDNWLIYSPLDYTDADSRFGDITCLTSMKDAIYCWQDKSFGRISVNERSLVKDTNSNMIQLGTGGVVQRVDYIDTIHGMSANQHVCENIANRIYWIDDKNKVVMVSDGVNSTNLSEHANVQSILNSEFDNTNLAIGYDSQSDELLCKCLKDGKQLIFNTKLNLATSIYTRNYLESFRLDNNLYGITTNDGNFSLYQFGGIDINDMPELTTNYMPSTIQFVVNDNSSITKVFDNQEIVFSDASMDVSQFSQHSNFQFNTNISNQITTCQVLTTSREGNLRYSIPREQCADYGNRMRGKWLKVSIMLDGNIENAISHVITKFRQSF